MFQTDKSRLFLVVLFAAFWMFVLLAGIRSCEHKRELDHARYVACLEHNTARECAIQRVFEDCRENGTNVAECRLLLEVRP